MNNLRDSLVLYAVTDRAWLNGRTLKEQVEEALRGGVTMVQLREKELPENEFEKEALEIKELCRKYNVPFIINDNVNLAVKINADGVHVGQSDMKALDVRKILGPDKIIGVTAKTVDQAVKAMEAGADYLGSGAVFGSSTKTDTERLDHNILRQICESVTIPVVAIGGITAENVEELKGRKIAGVAVVSAVFGQPDIESATKELKKKVYKILN
ncbi:MAG: thiamine phosphate synthase [Butyrivibrio sp.]